jgi:hypothetical protein
MTSDTPHLTEASRKWAYRILRFGIAFFIITYGFAKLNGSQFTILASELDKPMGQVSGFWLTWYYFGYSPVYGNLIGVAQIAGGVMLMFRRTALLGSCLLLPVVANIVLIDIFYQIDLGALIVAILMLFGLLLILSFHKEKLLDVFWRKPKQVAAEPANKKHSYAKQAVRFLIVAAPAVFTYWVANYNNRAPTPIDGAWEVMSVTPETDARAAELVTVFFERNRASLCVFKRRDGQYEDHHFEVDGPRQTVTIWEQWLRKGQVIFTGAYELNGDNLKIHGKFANDPTEVMLMLRRRRQIAGTGSSLEGALTLGARTCSSANSRPRRKKTDHRGFAAKVVKTVLGPSNA